MSATAATSLVPGSNSDSRDDAEPKAVLFSAPSPVADHLVLMPVSTTAAINSQTASSHDEAISCIADELESLLPVRKIRR